MCAEDSDSESLGLLAFGEGAECAEASTGPACDGDIAESCFCAGDCLATCTHDGIKGFEAMDAIPCEVEVADAVSEGAVAVAAGDGFVLKFGECLGECGLVAEGGGGEPWGAGLLADTGDLTCGIEVVCEGFIDEDGESFGEDLLGEFDVLSSIDSSEDHGIDLFEEFIE